jgi:hypothetical protein
LSTISAMAKPGKWPRLLIKPIVQLQCQCQVQWMNFSAWQAFEENINKLVCWETEASNRKIQSLPN